MSVSLQSDKLISAGRARHHLAWTQWMVHPGHSRQKLGRDGLIPLVRGVGIGSRTNRCE